MCGCVSGVTASGHVINYSGSANCESHHLCIESLVILRTDDLPPSVNLQSRFPVNLVPHPGSRSGSHHRWQLLEASRDNWNPNELEPMTSNGISPLLEFTERREGPFYCIVPVETGLCNYSNNKKGRMLSHIRIKHLNFRPFPCGGQCGTQGW